MSSVSEASINNQQIAKEVKEKDLINFVDERLAEVHDTMSELRNKANDMDKHNVVPKSKGEDRRL